MNFKTTIVLIILLALIGGIVIYTNTGSTEPAPVKIDQSGRKLFDITSDHVNRIEITAAGGARTRLIKEDGKWKLTDPVKAGATEFAAADLASSLADLHSMGTPDKDPGSTGLDKPSYQVELGTDDGKVTKFKLGSLVGLDSMYAQVDGSSTIDIVSASLDKTLKNAAVDVRDKHLTTISEPEVKQVRITEGNTTLELSKAGGKWLILSPDHLLGDESAITSLISSITTMEASDFVKPDAPALSLSPFARPRMTVWISTQAPTTQPSSPGAPKPASTTITFGMPESASAAAHYYVQTSDGIVAKVDKTAMESLKKTELDLRDKVVAMIAPANVIRISIVKQTFAPKPPPSTQPATQPSVTTRPSLPSLPIASKTIVLVKRKNNKMLGPVLPTTQASTRPTTQPASVVVADSVWQFEDDDTTQINDANVSTLLSKFFPLQAEKFVESLNPEAIDKYSIELTAQPTGQAPTVYHIDVINPPDAKDPEGSFSGLNFQVVKSMIDALNLDFVKK